MALSEFELKKIEKEVGVFLEAHRPPPHIRPELDIGFRVKEQSVEIFEIRPRWRHPGEKIEAPVAKATYVKSRKVWRVFWQRADLKWHRYDPHPEVPTLQKFLSLVGTDEHACFFG